MYPSPVDLEKLQVQILHESDSKTLRSSIHPIKSVNGKAQDIYFVLSPLFTLDWFLDEGIDVTGSFSSGMLDYRPDSHVEIAPTSAVNARNEVSSERRFYWLIFVV